MPTIPILFESRELILCVKPSGVLSQSAEGTRESDLLTLLHQQTKSHCFPVHRLDRPTGGCMMVAKTPAAAARLSALLQAHQVQKEYLAVVCGSPSLPQATLVDQLFYDRIRDKAFVSPRPKSSTKEAILHYTLLQSVDTAEGTLSLLSIRLETGRTHQIRVQLASRGLPLWGDRKYGSPCGTSPALWSHALSFPDGATQRSVTAPPPETLPWQYFSTEVEA